MKTAPWLTAGIVSATCWGSAAGTQGDAPAIPTPTHDWGCEVLLCLANPNGPMAVAPCVPPIRRLWHELAHGHAFPTCSLATGPKGRSYAVRDRRYYDPCPAGTSELDSGLLAALAAPMNGPARPTTASGAVTTYSAGRIGATYLGIGAGPQDIPRGSDGSPAAKVCVGGLTGSRVERNGDYDNLVGLYKTIYTAPAQPSANVIDVYIDNSLWQSVRW